MAPQDVPPWRKGHDDESLNSRKVKDDDLRTTFTPVYTPSPMPTPSAVFVTADVTDDGSSYRYKVSYTPVPPLPPPVWRPSEYSHAAAIEPSSTSTWSTPSNGPYYESQKASKWSVSTSSTAGVAGSTGGPEDSFEPPYFHGSWNDHKGGVYAAAAVTPIVILGIIGLAVFLCLRKRRRQRRSRVSDGTDAQEMKMSSNPTRPLNVQPYIAPPPAVSPHYAPRHQNSFQSSPADQTQPIILGPISSGVNGAYLTGMDTSDAVSVRSGDHLRPEPSNPFADNNSLSEPPPPYRPRSEGPPSFTTNSRQSSMRSMAPPATSRTHLIERSPFDDPMDDDTVSEISGPTTGREGDAMSAVSDISYQFNEPQIHRPSR